MTDISVFTTSFAAEDLSWDLSPDHDATYKKGDTLDVSLFTQAQHFAKGFIPSGCALGRKTSGGLLGPYLDAASDGTQTCVGLLAASIQVVRSRDGSLKTKVGCAVVKAFAVVATSRLPFNSTNQALGGYLDANAKADLPLIFWDTTA